MGLTDKRPGMVEKKPTKSALLHEELIKYTAGPHSNLRVRMLDRPLFFDRAKGSHLWDVDGNEYIEYWSGAGPGILGYGNEEYIAAVQKQVETLPYFHIEAQAEFEVELAKKLVQHIPCADKVRFCVTGTDADQLAIRLARAHTKRRYFLRFEGHYHGWLDSVLGGKPSDDPVNHPNPVEFEGDYFTTEGRAPNALEHNILVPWNDIEILEKVLEKHGEEVALITMEPYLCNGGCCPPRPGYIERVQQLCAQYGIVFGFDEVITGFRLGLGGAQAELGITPDIATFGKAMANGAPIAMVAGKAEIMDLLLERRVLGAGTFNGNPVSTAAALATVKILERDDGAFYKRLDERDTQLRTGLREISRRRGIPTILQGPRAALFFNFSDQDVIYTRADIKKYVDFKKLHQYVYHLTDEGVVVCSDGRHYLSGAHTKKDIDDTLERADRAMGKI